MSEDILLVALLVVGVVIVAADADVAVAVVVVVVIAGVVVVVVVVEDVVAEEVPAPFLDFTKSQLLWTAVSMAGERDTSGAPVLKFVALFDESVHNLFGLLAKLLLEDVDDGESCLQRLPLAVD